MHPTWQNIHHRDSDGHKESRLCKRAHNGKRHIRRLHRILRRSAGIFCIEALRERFRFRRVSSTMRSSKSASNTAAFDASSRSAFAFSSRSRASRSSRSRFSQASRSRVSCSSRSDSSRASRSAVSRSTHSRSMRALSRAWWLWILRERLDFLSLRSRKKRSSSFLSLWSTPTLLMYELRRMRTH